MASRGINKVIIVGNLGRDPEVRYTPNGSAVATLNVATSAAWKDKDGQLQEQTEWHRVVFFSRLAEIAGEYLKKGAKIYVEGRLKTRKWQDKDAQDHYTTEIIGNEMQMLDGRSNSPANEPSEAAYAGDRERGQKQEASPSASSLSEDNFDDDIPF